MMETDWKFPVLIARVLTLVLGIVVMGVGLHSHFNSAWLKRYSYDINYGDELYKLCDSERDRDSASEQGTPCPRIALERYFVSITIICFILSFVFLIASMLVELNILRMIDAGYHLVAAFLLLIAGILYVVSAVQIDNYTKKFHPQVMNKESFYRGEKIAAGVLNMFQCLFYGAVTALIFIWEI